MKSLRLILALSFASLLALSFAHAGDDKAKDKPADKACAKTECGRQEKTDKADCGTEGKSCSYTGDKAKSEKAEETKR